MGSFFNALKQAAYEFIEDDCMSSGAAIAYYSIFALPPLLVIVFLLASYAGVSPDQINAVVKDQLGMPSPAAAGGNETGASATKSDDKAAAPAGELQSLAYRARPEQLGGIGALGRILGVLLLIFTATGLFAQLQLALNRAWEVEPDPDQGGVRRFFLKRLLSLGMILVIAVLLLVSMVVSALITEIMRTVQGATPDTAARVVGFILDNLVTLGLGTLLFAAMFKILPDADMIWRDTFVGAALTALLFVIGKALVAWYLQSSDLGASWGDTAGSLIAVLAWLYYSSLIVLFGAEVTQVWAKRYGGGIRASAGAVRAVRETRHEREQS